MVWDILLSLTAFMAVALAVRGNTWNKCAKSTLKKITGTGWLALALGAVTLSLSIVKAVNADRAQTERQSEAANQVLADLAPQATFYRLALSPKVSIRDFKDEISQFASFLEAKLNRHSRDLPVDAVAAGERALTEQRQLVIMLERWEQGRFTEEDARRKVRRCFESAKALGDELLKAMGNQAGMDKTVILTEEDDS